MTDNKQLTNKRERIYFVEFLRVFLILSVFLVHIGDRVDPELKNDILELCHTQKWALAQAVRYFLLSEDFSCMEGSWGQR